MLAYAFSVNNKRQTAPIRPAARLAQSVQGNPVGQPLPARLPVMSRRDRNIPQKSLQWPAEALS
jgi:hypothetical protein